MNEEKLGIETEEKEEDILSVEKKNTKIHHIGRKAAIIIVAALIVIVIIGIIVFKNLPGKEPQLGTENTQTIEVLYDYEASQVSKIEIQNHLEGDNIVLTSFMNGTVQNWNIEGQKYDDVNQLLVRNIAQSAEYLESKYVLESENANLNEYGLDNPCAEVTITYSDGNVNKLKIGNSYGNSEGAYVTVEGKDKIYIVSNYTRVFFTYKLSDLLNLPTLSRTATSAQTLSIFDKERNNTVLSYLPNPIYGTEAWFLVLPTDSETKSEAVDNYFSQISGLALNSYYCEAVGEDITKFGFDMPEFELQSYSENFELLDHFIVGKTCEDDADSYYCVLLGKDDKIESSPVYLVKKDVLKTVYANPVTLANPYLLSLNINWLRSGKIIVDNEVYEIKIDRQLKYNDEGEIIYNDDGSENTSNTYYINGKKLDETQFKYFYRTFLFLQIEGVTPADTEKKDAVWEYELEVVIPVLNNDTKQYEMKEINYTGTYYLINDTFAVFESNQSENAVFTVRKTSLDKVKEALNLLLEGRMPTK